MNTFSRLLGIESHTSDFAPHESSPAPHKSNSAPHKSSSTPHKSVETAPLGQSQRSCVVTRLSCVVTRSSCVVRKLSCAVSMRSCVVQLHPLRRRGTLVRAETVVRDAAAIMCGTKPKGIKYPLTCKRFHDEEAFLAAAPPIIIATQTRVAAATRGAWLCDHGPETAKEVGMCEETNSSQWQMTARMPRSEASRSCNRDAFAFPIRRFLGLPLSSEERVGFAALAAIVVLVVATASGLIS